MTAVRRAGTASVVLGVLVLAVLGLLRAADPGGTPSRQQQVDAVAATLRCPTCQGLSIKESSSILAAGSRAIIEQQLDEGRTPDQVRQYFVDRYGESVLLSPDPAGPGLFAWLVPALALSGAGVLIWRWMRRGRTDVPAGAEVPVDQDALAAREAHRAGRLAPDNTPAGDALRAALLARIAAEEDDEVDVESVHRADVRLGAAYRRYTAKAVTAPAPARGAGSALPRRAVTVGAVGLVLVAAATGVVLTVRDRGAADPVTGDALVGIAAATGAPGTGGVPSAPPGAPAGMPQTPAEWVALGRAYDRAQEFTQAVAAYDMALQLQPAADDVVLMRADVLVRSGNPGAALPTLAELADRYPDNPDVLLILGLAQNGTADPSATTTLRRFLELAPDSPAAAGVRNLLAGR